MHRRNHKHLQFQSTIEILTTAKMFTSEHIIDDNIKLILSAGLNAPSARNSQPWHFSVVTDKEILNQINEAMASGMPKLGLKDATTSASTRSSIDERVKFIN